MLCKFLWRLEKRSCFEVGNFLGVSVQLPVGMLEMQNSLRGSVQLPVGMLEMQNPQEVLR